MPRTADHFAELMGNTDTAGSVRRGRSGLYVLRPRTSIHDGNAFTQRPMTVRVNRSRPNSLSVTTPKASTNTEVSSPSGLENADIEQISLDDDADMEITVNDGGSFMVLLEDANMDGVKHLSDKDRRIRAIWLCVLVLFTCLALYQIHNQVMMYINTPVATNIEADYPQKINFPTVAVCNNNQYRLTFLTGGVVQNRVPKNSSVHIKDINPNSTNVFDKALLNSWDMDAVKFLRYAAHWKSRMILRCIYPNGTRCRLADFKPVWTMTGLCWAINTDPQNPVYVHGAGPSHALKLLLNVERYERVESCSPKFRTTSLPGLKILIYNQTDIPVQSQDGVNAPPGFTIDMPFRMQHRQKLPGLNCIAEDKEDGVKKAQDAKTCMIMNMLAEVERQCACSMRRAYQGDVPGALPFCNVEEYFNCVVPVFKWGYDGGFMTFDCMANCDEIDYIAWQDLNELPDHIFPKLIDHNDDEDEDDAENELDGLYADLDQGDSNDKDEHYSCEQNQLLDDTTVSRIKREAHRAYEKQSRYQEDILLRTKRLTEKMRQTSTRIQETRWGWRNDNFTGIYERLSESTTCFSNMSTTHNDVFNAINNKGAHSEKQRAKKLINLLNRDNNLDILNIADSIHTISDTKRHFGSETIEELEKTLDFVDLFVHKVYSLYDEDSYTDKLSKRLERVDKMIMLVEQYEAGRLQRKVWAEKMQARNMRHFFDEDFFDSWYNIIVRELDVILGKTINDLEEDVDLLRNISSDVGAVLLFGTAANNHTKLWNDFIEDILDCTFGEVKNWTVSMAKEFKDVMHDFQTASTNLFRKELTGYLDNFEFGPKFVKENFAQVNVFLHKMNVEHWKQESTYSIWSLFCDVGGALGLFLGASLLTIIELLYQCCRFGVANNKWWSVGAKCKENKDAEAAEKLSPIKEEDEKLNVVEEVKDASKLEFPKTDDFLMMDD
uniref:Sodium channel protein Nach n=1 Tax=Panagrellus redivivus TaxID=6233 RepID=A0A7E4W0Y6_PANRE